LRHIPIDRSTAVSDRTGDASAAAAPTMMRARAATREFIGSLHVARLPGEARQGRATLKPDLPNVWRTGKDPRPEIPPITWKSKPMASLAAMAIVKYQLSRLSRDREPKPRVSRLSALIISQMRTARLTRKYRRWMAG
jgi:hypothetical protein